MFKIFKNILIPLTNNALAITSRTCTASALRSRKPKSTINRVKHFVDKCHLRVMGGNGGDGAIGFSSTFHTEHAGTCGGDGGNGAHVILLATNEVTSLNNVKPLIVGEHGEKGSQKDCNGKSASHTIVKVPIGTIVRRGDGTILGDLDKEGTMFLAARGGSGGRGNTFFKTDILQAPNHAEYGAEGESFSYILEVKSMADIGLLGFPNAGKSTLLRAVSRARPKVAEYPFTTLHPHIGMVLYEDYEQLAIADLPGLIPGSHLNHGLGIQFLQHAERCCCLMYVVDLSVNKPWEQFHSLQYELKQFNEELIKRPKLIIGNKIDLPESQKNLPVFKKHFKEMQVLPISAKTGINLSVLLKLVREIYDQNIKDIETSKKC